MPSQQRRVGFSLLEIIMGCMLFSTILIYLASIWGIHARTIGSTRSRMVATFIAGQEVENCITVGYSGVDALAALQWQYQTVTTTIRGVKESVQYAYKIETKATTDPEIKGQLKVVRVRVVFPEGSGLGNKKEIDYDTLIGETS